MFRFKVDTEGGNSAPAPEVPTTTTGSQAGGSDPTRRPLPAGGPTPRERTPVARQGLDDPNPIVGDRRPRERDERDARLDELERTFKATLRDKELASALAGMPLVPGAARQLTTLLRDDLDVIEADGQFKVRAQGEDSVVDYVRARLADPEFDHFIRPAGAGGVGAFGGQQTPPNHRANPAPLSPDEEVFASWKARQDRLSEMGFAPRGLKGRPIG